MRSSFDRLAPTYVLARGELITLRLAGGSSRIACIAGRLWVTASGQDRDAVLVPGDQVGYRGVCTIVVEALRTATVRVATGMR